MLPRRPLGKTGVQLSIIGLGGIVVSGMEQSYANRFVRELIDSGINYIDVAPTYGNAEQVLGIALQGYRDKVFLACKTHKRTKAEAGAELRESLRRLRTDYFDLYQLHALSSMRDVERAFAPNGAMEAFVEARDKGLVRFLGFSAHSVKAGLAAMERFNFDTILFPINFVLYYRENFGPQVLKRAHEKGVACLAIKAMARSKRKPGAKRMFPKCWYQPIYEPHEASLALRWTLSEGVTAVVPPGDERLFRLALKIAHQWTPVTDDERKALRELAKGLEPIFQLDV
ncbi:MAG TPA: aldo/keto reductase [Armatimonadetes bacterium]|nr:aldo/keto reductase [Armatimonadota bacterium]